MTNAIILSIGDELVLGQTVDTNSAWLAARLAAIGIDIVSHITVPDSQSAIEHAIRSAAPQADVLLITGGLGPTEDDLTRQALAAAMGVPLELDRDNLETIRGFFTRLGRPMPRSNEIQAMVPRGAAPIPNPNGTAPGIRATLATATPAAAGPHSALVYVMPGVPKEMKLMFQASIEPELRARGGGAVILSRTVHTFGAGESTIAERLGDLMNRTRNPSVGTTVSAGIVSLRINARFPTPDLAAYELEATDALCRERLGSLVFGQDAQTLPEVVGALLKSAGATVALAESCTGGLIAKYLTDIPGSSAYVTHGWVTYANAAKRDLLGVPQALLEAHGAVSEPVVAAMADAARARSGATYALAVSGIAGPDGGTDAKPVGTVCLALASPSGTATRTFRFPGDREMIRDRSAKMALSMLRYALIGQSMP